MPPKTTSNYGQIFGLLIAIILLLLYAGTMVLLIRDVLVEQTDNLSDGATYILTTVGGLVSALVIVVLAVTDPGKNPADRVERAFTGASASTPTTSGTKWVVAVYLSIWLLVGLAAVIVGVMLYPDASSTLRDIGTNWLGLAVASAYAYFGIKPK